MGDENFSEAWAGRDSGTGLSPGALNNSAEERLVRRAWSSTLNLSEEDLVPGRSAVIEGVQRVDRAIARTLARLGIPGMRMALAIVFVWFGSLKVVGISPADQLVRETVRFLPLFSADVWVVLIGAWEVAIGFTFLFQSTTRVAIGLLALQMFGTTLPLFALPEMTFQPGRIPFAPTLEGQYIIKNLVLIAGAMVVGGTLSSRAAVAQRPNFSREEERQSADAPPTTPGRNRPRDP